MPTLQNKPTSAVVKRPPAWVRFPVYWGAGFFTLALALSAIFDPSIRVLHTLQALIYLAVIWLVRRSSSWGYGAGFFIAVLWNYTNLYKIWLDRGCWFRADRAPASP